MVSCRRADSSDIFQANAEKELRFQSFPYIQMYCERSDKNLGLGTL